MKGKYCRFFLLSVVSVLVSCGGSGGEGEEPIPEPPPVQEQVEQPVFSPEQGEYSEDTTITLSSATSDVLIYYTLDGSEPSQDSILYEGQIFIEGNQNTTRVRAIGFKDGFSRSAIAEANYRIAYPKIAAITASHQAQDYLEPFTLNLTTETEGSRIYYTLDGSTPDGNASPYPENGFMLGEQVDTSEGPVEVEVQAIALGEGLSASDIFKATYRFIEDEATPLPLPPEPYFESTRVDVNIQELDQVYDGRLALHNTYNESLPWRINKIKIIKSQEYTRSENAQQDAGTASLSGQSKVRALPVQANSKALIDKNIIDKKVTDKNTKTVLRHRDDIIPGKMLIKVVVDESAWQTKKNITQQELIHILGDKSAELLQEINIIGIDVISAVEQDKLSKKKVVLLDLEFDPSSLAVLEKILAALNQNPRVIYAEPDYKMYPAEIIPNDSLFADAYNLQTAEVGTVGPGINVTAAWERGGGHVGNKSVLIGVFDSGVFYDHPDLTDNIWTNPGEIPDNGIDDDGNGYIDDVRGYDFENNDNNPMDVWKYHGTHVAGIIAAKGNNNEGVSGVMWDANIVPLKIFDRSLTVSNAIRAVEYAKAMGVQIFNFSWRMYGNSEALKDSLRDAGLVVIAAGNDKFDNDKSPLFPASYDLDNIIAVAAIGRDSELIEISNYGKNSVDLAAPGGNIVSTSSEEENYYEEKTGTSMAAPHVTGVAGLIATYRNDLDALTLKRYILATVDKMDHLSERVATGGTLNADKAMAAVELDWFALDHDTGEAAANDIVSIPFSIDPVTAVAGEYEFEVEFALGETGERRIRAVVAVVVPPCFSAALVNDEVNFGTVRSYGTAEKVVSVKNTCNAPVIIEGLSADIDVGDVSMPKAKTIVYPFTTEDIPLNYIADQEAFGDHTGALRLDTAHDFSLSPRFSVSNIIGPRLEMELASVDVVQGKDTENTYSHRVTNSGDEPLTITYRDGPTFFDRQGASNPGLEWQDIRDTGRSLDQITSAAEDWRVSLSFTFPFYDQGYTEFYVNAQGRVSFGVPYKSLNHLEIPVAEAPALIAPFWNNLALESYEHVFFQDFGDHAVIQFRNADSFYRNMDISYQLVLHASGEFQFLYDTVWGYTCNASIGFQAANGSRGKSISYQDDYAQSGQSVKVIQSPWLTLDESQVTLQPGQSHTKTFTVSTEGLPSGQYQGAFSVDHNGSNDSNGKQNRVAVTLEVGE